MSQNWAYDRRPNIDEPGRIETQHQDTATKSRAPVQFRGGFHFSFRPKAIYTLMKATHQEWSKYKVPRMGAALAYYTIFSLAPLLVIAISVAGIVFGDKAVQGEIVSQIQGLMGADAARAVQTMIQSAHKPANQAFASIVGLAILFFGASGVFNEMQDALNEIWGVDTTAKTGIWKLIKTRFLRLPWCWASDSCFWFRCSLAHFWRVWQSTSAVFFLFPRLSCTSPTCCFRFFSSPCCSP
jgi:uncharacterized BrkB/YihY/UPF0761 family membrane protein